MIRFEYDTTNDKYDNRKINIEDPNHEDIYEIVNNFITFLKAITYSEIVIINGFKDAIKNIEDDIKENYIMIQDDEENNIED